MVAHVADGAEVAGRQVSPELVRIERDGKRRAHAVMLVGIRPLTRPASVRPGCLAPEANDDGDLNGVADGVVVGALPEGGEAPAALPAVHRRVPATGRAHVAAAVLDVFGSVAVFDARLGRGVAGVFVGPLPAALPDHVLVAPPGRRDRAVGGTELDAGAPDPERVAALLGLREGVYRLPEAAILRHRGERERAFYLRAAPKMWHPNFEPS